MALKASTKTITLVNSHTTKEHEKTTHEVKVKEVGKAISAVHKKMEDIEDNVRKVIKALKTRKSTHRRRPLKGRRQRPKQRPQNHLKS